MEKSVDDALAIVNCADGPERTIDITTTGRRSGKPRRIETWFYRVDDRIYLTGIPGRRGWAANLEAEPSLTFHLKNDVEADLDAVAVRVDEESERRRILTAVLGELNEMDGISRDLDRWVAASPLFMVSFKSVGEVGP
jgi:deazaflavin-dependent oxidoreductase (nitroreductase family)